MTDTELPRVTKGREPGVGDDPRIDTLVGMVMALTSEVSVLRERIDAHEKLAESGQAAVSAAVDAYRPDAQGEARRAEDRERLIEKVCRPLIASTHE